jgi:hypothetical protein
MNMRLHRGSQGSTEVVVARKSSSVHVLRDEEALRAALRRAAEFDQRAADALLSRSARYRSLLPDPPSDGPSAD